MKMHVPTAVTLASLVLAAAAAAQTDTARTPPKSTSRIPISKETPAPTPPRVDTVTMYRTDTVTKTQTDTVTITRVDTVRSSAGEVSTSAPPPPPRMLKKVGGFYIGVDGGTAVPAGDQFSTAQSTGWHLDVPFGWDMPDSPLGVRFSAGYSHFATKNAFENSLLENPQIMQGDADLKLRLPLSSNRIQIYALGGATYNRFKNVVQRNDDGTFTVGDNTGILNVNGGMPSTFDTSWHDAWGWNAGGGLQFGMGRANMFVESRYIRFNRNGELSQVPVVIGLSWY